MNPSNHAARRLACLAVVVASALFGTGCAANLSGHPEATTVAARRASSIDATAFEVEFGHFEDARVRTAGAPSGRPGLGFAGVAPGARSLVALRVSR